MRRSISNKCKKLLHIDTAPSSSPPAEHSFRCAAHERYKPKVDAPPQSSPVTPATTVEPEKVEDEEENADEEDEDDIEGEEEEEEEEEGEKNDKNRWRFGQAREPPKRLDSPSPLEAFTQDEPIVYEGEGWEALSQLQSPPPPPPPPPSSAVPLQRPGNAHRWTASPSTFDTTSVVLVLSSLDGCSIPINNRHLPLYASLLNSAGTSTCRCGGDAYVAVAALLRAWPDFARRVWGLVHTRAVYERDEALSAWLEPAKDKLRELLGDRGEIDRSVSDAVQGALRRRAQQLTGVGEATVDQWAREDMEMIDWLEGRQGPESSLEFIRNAFANMNF